MLFLRFTTKDLSVIEDGLRHETLCARKAHVYEHQARDPELQELMREAQRSARRHIRELEAEVNE